jgi:hypothetical protein
MEPTCDPEIWIEERRVGYVRYRRADGRRWEVHGICDARGDCSVGSDNPFPGPPEGRLDIPVTPEFDSCCPFRYVELPPARPEE